MGKNKDRCIILAATARVTFMGSGCGTAVEHTPREQKS